MAGSNVSTKPFQGNRWVSIVALDTTDETITVVAAGTSVHVHAVQGVTISGASSAALVPFGVEEVGSADVCVLGCAQMNGGTSDHRPEVTQDGLLIRAGTVAASGVARITINWSYRGGTAPTEV